MTRDLRHALEAGPLDAAAAMEKLKPIAKGANVRAVRVEAYGLIGEIAGRAFDASWETAERAAWVLLDVARHAEVLAEKRGLLFAMGRGFRNLWLMPFVHLAAFFKDYVLRLAFLDGWRGYVVAQVAASYAVYKRMRYYEMKRNPDSRDAAAQLLRGYGLDP